MRSQISMWSLVSRFPLFRLSFSFLCSHSGSAPVLVTHLLMCHRTREPNVTFPLASSSTSVEFLSSCPTLLEEVFFALPLRFLARRCLALVAALLLPLLPLSLGFGGRTPAAAAASEASAAHPVSVSYSAPSCSVSAAGPCVGARGGAAAPAAVDKPSRPIASPAVASAAAPNDRACCLLPLS